MTPLKHRVNDKKFVLGLDLDGCVADFYGYMRQLMVDWHGREIKNFTPNVKYGLGEWGIREGEYENLHRYAVVQRQMFKEVRPIEGAAQTLRDLSVEGVEIRIITHRLFVNHFHSQAASQTIEWLEMHGIPYRELCFVKNKWEVRADIYLDDSPENIDGLEKANKNFICFTNSTNSDLHVKQRADNWVEVGEIVRRYYTEWSKENGFPISRGYGLAPNDLRDEKYRFEL